MSKKKILAIILATALLTLVLSSAFLCWAFGLDAQKAANMARFFGAMRFIEAHYVEPVDSDALMDGAISGMVQSLGDPHSIYMGAKLYRQLTEQTEGHFGGIGVYMGFKEGRVQLISVIEGTPGERAGLRAGDEILAVDGVPVTDMQPEEVALHIRGEIGTEVELLVHREGEADREYAITRDTIAIRTAVGKMLDGGQGYIRIATFSENTGKEFAEAFDALREQGMKGLIIDLRENPGGLITSCVEIAREVVPDGPIVSVIERDGSKEEFDSHLGTSDYPIVVLIDGNSASASEILAGALQDTGAATLVGTKSYGKGSVQTVLPLYHEDAMKLTIARYYTPSGRSIDGTGIEPDVAVELPPGSTEDVQLKKAEEVLAGKIAAQGD